MQALVCDVAVRCRRGHRRGTRRRWWHDGEEVARYVDVDLKLGHGRAGTAIAEESPEVVAEQRHVVCLVAQRHTADRGCLLYTSDAADEMD